MVAKTRWDNGWTILIPLISTWVAQFFYFARMFAALERLSRLFWKGEDQTNSKFESGNPQLFGTWSFNNIFIANCFHAVVESNSSHAQLSGSWNSKVDSKTKMCHQSLLKALEISLWCNSHLCLCLTPFCSLVCWTMGSKVWSVFLCHVQSEAILLLFCLTIIADYQV